jgi:hypothetical protein
VDHTKSKQQKPKINLSDLARHLMPLPVQNRIYPDCPHDTAILIVVTSTTISPFSNCKTMRHQFAAMMMSFICSCRNKTTATKAFASTTKGLSAGTSAHNMTETQSREL